MSGTPLINSSRIGQSSLDYYYYPHETKPDYNRAFNTACLWAIENPTETSALSARIYHVKEEALRKAIL
jgi:hypothetical protein